MGGTQTRTLIWLVRVLASAVAVYSFAGIAFGSYTHPEWVRIAYLAALCVSVLGLRALESWRAGVA